MAKTNPPIQLNERTRSVVYVVALAIYVLALLTLGIGTLWGVLDAELAAETLALVTTVLGIATSGLGVAFRPTKHKTTADYDLYDAGGVRPSAEEEAAHNAEARKAVADANNPAPNTRDVPEEQ